MFKHTTEHSFITKHVMKQNMEYKKSGKRCSIIKVANVLWVFLLATLSEASPLYSSQGIW